MQTKTRLGMDRQRIRHACEPCRRKKTKCPGEKPTCSFCLRLKQECVYISRDTPKAGNRSRVSKPQTSSRRHRTPQSRISLPDFSPPLEHSHGSCYNGPLSPTSSPSWSFDNPEPPTDVLDHFAEVYRSRIYFQPLPLFRIDSLRARLDVFPRFLRFSFLALALQYTSHRHYNGVEAEATNFFAKSAQRTVDEICAGGAINIEVLQALCLLSLYHVKAKQPQAWISIGCAARLQIMYRLMSQDQGGSRCETDAHWRCFWSICLLETTFSPQYATLAQVPNPPPFPSSPPIPPSTPHNRASEYRQGQSATEETGTQDLGINAFTLQMVSIWAEISAYVHAIRGGRNESAWLSTSTFTRLTVKLYEIDTHIYQRHLLRHTAFNSRQLHEVQRDLEYWRPWILLQFVFHGCNAVLNHPFIHLHAFPGDNRSGQPGLFLQKTIDQALFHAGWIVRLIEFCTAIEFEVRDPLVGHVVAITATISWILQFARDDTVSSKSLESLWKCEKFLQKTSETWPHLTHQLAIIRDLQSVADQTRSNSSTSGIDITFKPSMLWKLLDYNVSRLSLTTWGSNESYSESHRNPNATLHVSTTFVHPLVEDEASQDTTLTEPADFSSGTNDAFGDLSLENFLFDYFVTDYPWQQNATGDFESRQQFTTS